MQNRRSLEQAELIKFALIGIDAQIAELERKRIELVNQFGDSKPAAPAAKMRQPVPAIKLPQKRNKFSAAHRAKLRAAAKRRWAKAKSRPK